MPMIRSIPPRTMSTLSRERRVGGGGRWPRGETSDNTGIQIAPVRKPRQWRYQTRPLFKRVRGPLVDVFNEAEEVLIVVDLGGFTRGEISLTMTPEQYILQATRGEQQFRELIDLPPNVDVERSRERLINGVLEIVLPRKKVPVEPVRRRATRRR
jgi:HSP20 family molecular chaperone IbpA